MLCPGSVKLVDANGPSEDTEFSLEGTRAHTTAAELLLKDNTAEADWGVDDWAAIAAYTNFCRDLPGLHFVETRLSLEPYIPGGFSTADFVAIHDRVLTIVDLKFGKGVPVYAEDNPQLMIYALGTLLEWSFLYEIDCVRMVIHQPRRGHVDAHEISTQDLMAWADGKLKLAVHDAMQPNARRVPGEKQCRWCPAKASCPELAAAVIERVTEGFDADAQYSLPDLLNYVDMARQWASAVAMRAMDELLAGKPIPGWKLVDGRSVRAWKDDEVTAEVLFSKLGDRAFEKKLLSPAKAEKMLGKKSSEWEEINQSLITWSTPKPTLAREGSAKQAIAINATEGFDE